MRRQTKHTFHVRTATQLRVLNSPVRHDIVAPLRDQGRMSAAELATALEITVAAVHYHLGPLERIGMVRMVGERSSGRRPAHLFELVFNDILIDRSVTGVAFATELTRGARLLLRHAERDVAAVIRDRPSKVDSGDFRITRDVVRLDDDDLATLNRMLMEVDEFVQAADRRAKPHRVGLTMAMAPPLTQACREPAPNDAS